MAGSASTFVRREIWGLDPEDPIVTAYARAVKVMQGRPADDPTSGAYQAAIHGTEAEPNKPLWNQCQHREGMTRPRATRGELLGNRGDVHRDPQAVRMLIVPWTARALDAEEGEIAGQRSCSRGASAWRRCGSYPP